MTLVDVNSNIGGFGVLGMLSLAKALGAVANDGTDQIPATSKEFKDA